MQLTPVQVDQILRILGNGVEVLLFGSRAKGTAREFSDIDLCIKSDRPVSHTDLSNWKERFQNSNIPYKVDVVLYEDLSEDFRQLISKTSVSLSQLGTPQKPA